MRITLTYNERKSDRVEEGENLTADEMRTLAGAIGALGHIVTPVEASGPADDFVDRLLASRPSLVFNVAEGDRGVGREARYPAIFNSLGLAYTGGGATLLHVSLDKRLMERVLGKRGVLVPRGCLVTPGQRELPDDLPFPVIIKPNYEGSSKGIGRDSLAENREEAGKIIDRLLKEFPEGLNAEQFIRGREFTVPLLEAFPGRLLEIVEHTFENGGDWNIYDYEAKHRGGGAAAGIKTVCPPVLSAAERREILSLADRAEQALPCPDMGRIDIRLREDGTAYFLETTPLPRLLPDGSLAVAAKARGLAYEEMFDLIIRSAARRHGLSAAPARPPASARKTGRKSPRELGITVGRFPAGTHNAITDVAGVKVGHVTHVEDGVPVPGRPGETTSVRTGITAVCPRSETLFNKHMAAGAFVLNGIGEMTGITQAREWGWLETPVLLTNTMSIGRVHGGIIQYLVEKHPDLGRKVDVTIPLVGETNDAFLNDVRLPRNTAEEAIRAIRAAKGGPVEQGSVGGGTGMITFDFAGGIGSSSRVIPAGEKGAAGYTVGVLVQANFGRMRNLTVDGRVVGRGLDPLFPQETRRRNSYGSVIVVVATDAPLLTAQLNRLAKRAALGLGRVGSHAASTSGEIVLAFSTGNQVPREMKRTSRVLNLTYVNDEFIDPLYEAVIEATEESVLNAVFRSAGQTGRKNRYAPPIPAEEVLGLLRDGGFRGKND